MRSNQARSRTLLTMAAVALSVVVTVLGLSFGGAPAAHAATISVAIQNYAFQPSALNVQVGDTVVWTNYDDAPHTVTTSSGPEQISSPTLQKGQSFSFKFTKPGTYKYYCAVHPEMTASVTVTPTSSPGGTSSGTTGGGSSSSSGSGAQAPPPSSGGDGSAQPPSATAPPSSSSSGGSSMNMGSGGAGTCSNEILVNAMLDPFITHFYRAHLERSPGQQANDALNPNQYTLTHTVLVEDMIAPAVTAVQDSLNGVVPFTNHFYRAHLERSPGQQVNDALNVNQYVTTHTVLAEDMTAPAVDAVEGSYGC